MKRAHCAVLASLLQNTSCYRPHALMFNTISQKFFAEKVRKLQVIEAHPSVILFYSLYSSSTKLQVSGLLLDDLLNNQPIFTFEKLAVNTR